VHTMPASPPVSPPAGTPLPRLVAFGRHAREVLLATLSIDALRASLATLAAQGRRDVPDMSAHGATSDGGFHAVAVHEGYYALFLQKDHAIAAEMSRLAASGNPGGSIRLDLVAAIIAECRARHIPLDLAIPPSHADYLDLLDRAGLWPRYQQVKAALTRLVAAQHDDGVRLWDFSCYDAYATEPIPAPGDRRASTQWFWEPNHFKRALGEKMLATMYHGGTAFGIRLTPQNLGARLVSETESKAVYRARASASRERLAGATENY
jgi:hypothetical protein